MITDRDLNEALQRSAVKESIARRIPTSEIGYTLALVKDLVDRLVEMESIPPEMIKAMVEIYRGLKDVANRLSAARAAIDAAHSAEETAFYRTLNAIKSER